jgi:hypothetical protein
MIRTNIRLIFCIVSNYNSKYQYYANDKRALDDYWENINALFLMFSDDSRAVHDSRLTLCN